MKKYFLMLAVAMTMAGAPLYAQMLGFSHSVSVMGVIPTGQFSKSVRIENAALPIFERSQIGSDAAFGIGFSYRIGKSFDVSTRTGHFSRHNFVIAGRELLPHKMKFWLRPP